MTLQQTSKPIFLAGVGQITAYSNEGNETLLIHGNANLASGATIGSFVNGSVRKYHITRITIRPLTAIVDGDADGVITLKKTADGTAIASATTVKSIAETEAVLGTDTTRTKEFLFAAGDTLNIDILNPGDILQLANTTGTSATGTVAICVFGREVA